MSKWPFEDTTPENCFLNSQRNALHYSSHPQSDLLRLSRRFVVFFYVPHTPLAFPDKPSVFSGSRLPFSLNQGTGYARRYGH